MPRLNEDRQNKLEPKRIEYAIQKLKELDLPITYQDDTEIRFLYRSKTIKLYPYSGWYSGKGVGSGRGLKELLSKLIINGNGKNDN